MAPLRDWGERVRRLVAHSPCYLAGALNIPVQHHHRAVQMPGTLQVWQSMRRNWISNRVFIFCENTLDHCCYAWNTLIDPPRPIISLGMHEWAWVLIQSGL